MTTSETGAVFDNGMTDEEDKALFDAISAVRELAAKVELLPRHRSYSLALTKLDETRHWLTDRYSRSA